jgi:small neutral amino acid transporter SnatA (MarC family)
LRDFWLTTLGMFAAVAPLGVLPLLPAGGRSRLAVGIGAPVVAFVLLVCAAALADPVLDALAVSGENFELAAGLLMLPLAFHLMVRGESMLPPAGEESGWWWLAPLALPGLVSPAALAGAVAYSSRFGLGVTAGAEGLVMGIAAAVFLGFGRSRGLALGIVNRFLGAGLVLVAAELVVDAIRSV